MNGLKGFTNLSDEWKSKGKKNPVMKNDSFDFCKSIDTIFKDLILVVVCESVYGLLTFPISVLHSKIN